MKFFLILNILLITLSAAGQALHIRKRDPEALTGSEFAESIAGSSLTLKEREKKIRREIRSGNIPNFYRTLIPIKDTVRADDRTCFVSYDVLPDYLAIGSDDDYFYCPMSPILAQRVARFLKCSLPTRKMVDQIYQAAEVKMVPEPIPPSDTMNTVPVFIRHNNLVHAQRMNLLSKFPLGDLVAGNKKDVVISNKIYREDGRLRVVIYGWHQPGGKPIQPLYGGHTADWVDYSHGIRLVQKKVNINGKIYKIRKVLRSPELFFILSDKGIIRKPFYSVSYQK